MERSIYTQTQTKKKKEGGRMTVYFDKRGKEQTEEERKNQENLEAVGSLVNFVFKPVILWQLWNWCVPTIFGLPPVGYLQSLALFTMSRILFDKNESKINQ